MYNNFVMEAVYIMDKTKNKKLAKSVWIFFIVVILIIILGLFILSLVFKNKDVTPSIFGYSLFLMDEDGMGDAVPSGSLVIAKNYSPSTDNIGDAILCEKVEGYGTTVLRLSAIKPNTKTVMYEGFFEKDPNTIITVPAKNLVGQAVSYHLTLGKIISFVTTATGVTFMIVIPALLLAFCELLIALLKNTDSKKRKNKENFKKQMNDFDIPDESPFSEKSRSARKSTLSIDNIILGKDLNNGSDGNHSENDLTLKSKPTSASLSTMEFNSLMAKSDSNSIDNKVTIKPEKVIVRPSSTKKASVDMSSPFPAANAEETTSEPPKSEKTAPSKAEPTQEPSEEQIAYSNNSLAHLIKLMEEQEKLLQDKAKDD